MFDHTLLGMRLFEALRGAARAGRLSSESSILPRTARVRGALIEMRLTEACGLDLRAMNRYRWHPSAEAVQLENEQHRVLSSPFDVCDLDFGELLKAACADADAPALDDALEVEVTADGVWNAVAVWFDLGLSDHATASSASSSSWRQAVYFLGELPVRKGESVRIQVHRDSSQFLFSSDATDEALPRSAMVANWHFDMLHDEQRNAAYQRAIERAVAKKKKSCDEVRSSFIANPPSRL